jgi:hypothetical protein
MSKRIRAADENVPPNAEADEDEAFSCEHCDCERVPRVGWTAADFLSRPCGVHEATAPADGSRRFHATFGVRRGGEALHLGCFASASEASDRWDDEARRRGLTVVNRPPRPRETSILDEIHTRAAFAELAGFPRLSSDREWRLRQLDAALRAAAAGAVDGTWEGPGAVLQRDHCALLASRSLDLWVTLSLSALCWLARRSPRSDEPSTCLLSAG